MQHNPVIYDRSEIKIGIIGPRELNNLTRPVLKAFPNFNPLFQTIHTIEDIVKTTIKLMDDVEVLMFTEYHSYLIAKQAVNFTVPVHHMPLMATGLYRSLSIIKNKFDTEVLSIDTVEKQYVEQVLAEFKDENYELIIFPISSKPDISTLVDFHIENYKKHQSIVLTGVQEVANELSQHEIPCELVIPTQQDMIVSFERALLAATTRRDKESQIVFGLVNIDHFRNVVLSYTSEHEVQLLKLKIQQLLLDYIKDLDGHLINLGGEEYSFITTRGIFERETRGYKFIPLLLDAKKKLGITLSLGVGFGRTASEAGNHARLALSQAKDSGGNVCYIVREDRSVLGPVDISTHKQYEQYDLAIVDQSVLKKAEQAGMSASYMTKLMARVARHRKIDYTAQELADTLNVTVRSAHRILLKWMDADIVEIIGEEKLSHKGRPRRIYRLSFIDEEGLD